MAQSGHADIVRFLSAFGGQSGHAPHAAFEMGLISSRCAETAEPHSRTVLASMTRPCFSSMERSFRLPAGSCGSIQTTSMLNELRQRTDDFRQHGRTPWLLWRFVALPPSALPSRALPPAAFDHEFDELGWLAGAFDV